MNVLKSNVISQSAAKPLSLRIRGKFNDYRKQIRLKNIYGKQVEY